MYYLCSENKGADQLRGYREADLRLCFRTCKKPVFSRRGSYDVGVEFSSVKFFFFFFFFDSVKCPFQDYFTHRDEPIDRWAKRENPGKTT